MSPGQVREFLDSLSPDLKERVKEIMRDASERPGGGHTLLPWEKQ